MWPPLAPIALLIVRSNATIPATTSSAIPTTMPTTTDASSDPTATATNSEIGLAGFGARDG